MVGVGIAVSVPAAAAAAAGQNCVGTAQYSVDETTNRASVTGTFTNCSPNAVSKRIQLDRGVDSSCYNFAPNETRTVTYQPSIAPYPGDARWVDCDAP